MNKNIKMMINNRTKKNNNIKKKISIRKLKKSKKINRVSNFNGGCHPEFRHYFRQKSINESKCSPIFQEKNVSHLLKNNIRKSNKNSCLDNDVLLRLVRAYNNYYPSKKIVINKKKPSIMYNKINKALMSQCGDKNELCWAKQQFVKDDFGREIIEFNFKPIMPKKWYCDKIEWLNTLDIDNVLHQYQQKYPEFVSYGPTPIDFDTKLDGNRCVTDELCKINLKKLINKGKKYIGVVFNLDPHTKGGSHWIAMFCNIPKKTINYWDSYGYKPPTEVKILMDRLKSQGDSLNSKYNKRIYSGNNNIKNKYGNFQNKKFSIKINPNRHQYKNSECGVYCINFIVNMLEGKTFEDITQNIVRDDETNALRSKYFIPL